MVIRGVIRGHFVKIILGSILNGKIIVCGGYNERGTMKYVESMSFNEDGTCLGWTEEESMNISRYGVILRSLGGHFRSKFYFNILFQISINVNRLIRSFKR